MVIEINLSPHRYNYEIPLNYQYPLSAAVFYLVSQSSEKFATWLHEIGYRTGKGKPYKMFTFSKLITRPIDRDAMKKKVLKSDGNLKFFFSSPVNDEIILNFVQGAMKVGRIGLGGVNLPQTDFDISQINLLPQMNNSFSQTYQSLSPICVSNQENGKVKFINPTNDNTVQKLENNLREKYKIIFQKECEEEFNISFVNSNIFKPKDITIKENTNMQGIIRAFETHITITGSQDIHKLAQESGIGERNSMGFGMIRKSREK